MTHETPEQRRTRLIEQYVRDFRYKGELLDDAIALATELAEAVIAATPQESEPPTVSVARYPSEAETRLIELCETAIANLQARGASSVGEMLIGKLAAIKKDLGVK